MRKKIFKFTIIILVITIVAALCIWGYLSGRTVFNQSEKLHGNTTGNLNNNGLFCEYDGTIYFSNPSDQGCLYAMNPDCTDIRRLNTDCVQSINVDENHIYYLRTKIAAPGVASILQGHVHAVIRTDKKGAGSRVLYDSPAGVVNLCGNYVYYQHYSNADAFSFYRVRIDGQENQCISKNGYFPASVHDGNIYFVNVGDDHNIYRYSPSNGAIALYMEANAYMVDMQGNYMYYIDLSSGYRLVRINVSNLEKEYLTSSREGKCIRYNVYGDKIFYALEGSNSALYRMNADTSDRVLLYEGNITSINCTSKYTFFQLFGSDMLMRVPTSGEPAVEQIVLQ